MVSESSYNTAMLYHDYFCLLGYNVNFLEKKPMFCYSEYYLI